MRCRVSSQLTASSVESPLSMSLCPLALPSSFRGLPSVLLDQFPGMPSNHQVFIGLHDAHGCRAAFARNDGCMHFIAARINADAEKLQAVADAQTDGCGVF